MNLSGHVAYVTRQLQGIANPIAADSRAYTVMEGAAEFLKAKYGRRFAAEALYALADQYAIEPRLRDLPPDAPGVGA